MKKNILFFFFFLFFTLVSQAQTWKWVRQATGDAQEDNFGLAIDKDGNTYITGEWSYCNGNPDTAVFGSFTLKYPDKDFLVKYDTNGNVLWARSGIGDKVQFNWVQGYSVIADNNDDVYEGGIFEDTVNFGTYKLVDIYSNYAGFIVKYNSIGSVLWAIEQEGTPNCLAVDNSNNIYVTGGSDTGSVVYLNKYNPTGNLIWSRTSSPACGLDQAYGVVTDASKNVYITGQFGCSSISFGSNTLINNANISVFLVKYDSNGNVLWARGSKGTTGGANGANAVVIDKNNDITITGGFANDSVTFGTKTIGPTNGAIFLVKYDSTGDLLWAKSIASPGGHFGFTQGYALAADECNDIYVVGGCAYTISSGSLSYSVPNNSNDPSFVMEFDCAGNPVTGFMLPDGGDDYIGMVLDKTDNIILSGDLVGNTGFGTDTLKPFCAEASFISKGSFGQAQCCKNIDVSISDSSNNGGLVTLTAKPSGGTYLWNGGSTSQSIIVNFSGSSNYSVYVIDSMGCQCGTSVNIGTPIECGQVFVPDAFSPNGDGQNDVLYVRDNCIKTMDFIVFDRWGNKVFESGNTNTGWDGTYNGQPMNTGSYAYYLHATMLDGSSVEKHGNISLVR